MMKNNSLVIIIDQWAIPGHPPLISDNIVKFLDSGQVSTAILASYNCNMAEYNANNVWYNNEKTMFDHARLTEEYIKNSYVPANYIKNLYVPANPQTNPSYLMSTNLKFLNYHNADLFQIAMRADWQLVQYLLENPQIKNLFVVGGKWDMCVRDRPLGYLNLFKLFFSQQINILTYNGCVGTKKITFGWPVELDKEIDWVQISDNVYQYVPK